MLSLLKQRFQRGKDQFPQALLLLGPLHGPIEEFATYLIKTLQCESEHSPCGDCQSCQLIAKSEHPDVHLIIPEKKNAAIKIEQIRTLAECLYTSPQLHSKRIILINPADKMNNAASNSLLKMLEEPPESVHFILLAESLSLMLPTIISRCQQWSIPFQESAETLSWLQYIYPPESERGMIINQANILINELIDLKSNKNLLFTVAERWSKLPFVELIWFLFLLVFELIKAISIDKSRQTNIPAGLSQLATCCEPFQLFALIKELQALTQKLNQSVALNQQLSLENLLRLF